MGKYNQIECMNCDKKFIKNWHPRGYICPWCDSIATKELLEVTDKEAAEKDIAE